MILPILILQHIPIPSHLKKIPRTTSSIHSQSHSHSQSQQQISFHPAHTTFRTLLPTTSFRTHLLSHQNPAPLCPNCIIPSHTIPSHLVEEVYIYHESRVGSFRRFTISMIGIRLVCNPPGEFVRNSPLDPQPRYIQGPTLHPTTSTSPSISPSFSPSTYHYHLPSHPNLCLLQIFSQLNKNKNKNETTKPKSKPVINHIISTLFPWHHIDTQAKLPQLPQPKYQYPQTELAKMVDADKRDCMEGGNLIFHFLTFNCSVSGVGIINKLERVQ